MIFPDFSHADILVVGDVMLDRYWYGSADRISPEAPVPVVKVDVVEERPGGAANVAMNIAALGCSPHLIGLTGVDDAARFLETRLSKVNVTCDFISVMNHPTTIKLRVLSHNQQLIRLDFEKCFNGVDSLLILERIKLVLPKTNMLVLSDYAKGALICVHEIIMLARAAKLPVLVDPKGIHFSNYQGATLLTPNLSEFEAVVGTCKNEKTLVKYGMEIINDYQFSALLITRSENGMTLLQLGKDPLHLPAQSQEVYDVTGAGDTVIGVLAAALASGNSLEKSCFLANTAAGLVLEKLGVSTVTCSEIKFPAHNDIETSFGIVNENELKKVSALARARGEKIVMTNGVFDILHAGHIHYLSNARRLGDRLIVAVNSDGSTKRLKGKNRPLNSLSQRMTVLAALEVVDWVVPFSENTPQRLIANILPDILVKGGDYQPDQISGSKEVWQNGGKVMVLNFKDGYSTTSIINAAKFV